MTKTAVPTITPIPPIPTTESNVDIVIDPASIFEPVIVQVGQTFAVQPPFTAEWNVEYQEAYLTLIDTHQNPQEWIFQAKSPSESEIRFTGNASCPENQECPPMAAEFVITILIEQ